MAQKYEATGEHDQTAAATGDRAGAGEDQQREHLGLVGMLRHSGGPGLKYLEEEEGGRRMKEGVKVKLKKKLTGEEEQTTQSSTAAMASDEDSEALSRGGPIKVPAGSKTYAKAKPK
ncbi:uncharacterized protein LOC127804187 [Diospyros lotus]|uniref:uncharacterized protein LOC127804185 n=1 Tax=Diospyros lotus TaxID=55363 RepID=UPI002253CA85|nr:uncharacterized protein LOC127804185 [Diospyros lotus]XP_052196941.1 uncharacterized protein LOC127804185 [Diospyros lotus]XP_052196942.1 uncharacterized protein LOC127804185 [Diospyros lotus]XP_052196943.1 uncharacterized protein LOC127804187 [Diospyros lotus]XP_052196944.1 uncharacterized protein LOC127804187 [Diospyros lotus]XP_052196945.1 uncharacterized protein LOC127804187 [Diospyros lotus]